MTASLRSMLFVPGDSERKLEKATSVGADSLIIDLEDAVSESRKDYARELTAQFLTQENASDDGPQLWVRMNPLTTPYALADLVAVVGAAPSGIVLPKIYGPSDIAKVGNYLDILEAAHGLESGSIRILPVVTETPASALNLNALGDDPGSSRVYGFTWGAEDLSAELGASTNLGGDGQWSMTYQIVRSQMLMAAKGTGVHALETLFVDIADTDGLRESTRAARAEGFTGRIAIHPGQVEAINEAFTPSPEELDHAQRVVEAFASSDTGTVALDGKMLDAPHLKQARQVLSAAGR